MHLGRGPFPNPPPSGFNRSTTLLPGAPLGLRTALIAIALLFGIAAAREARAACGDYVIVTKPARAGMKLTAVEPPMAAHDMDHSRSGSNPVPCPCSGPQCRAGDSTPVSTAVPVSFKVPVPPPGNNYTSSA